MTEEVGNDGLTDAERKQFAGYYHEKVVKRGLTTEQQAQVEAWLRRNRGLAGEE